MELLIGLVVGILVVVIVIAVSIVFTRTVPERRGRVRHGDGRHSIGPVPDNYGGSHIDHHVGPS